MKKILQILYSIIEINITPIRLLGKQKFFIKRDSLCTKEKVAKKKTHNYKTKLSAPGVERVSSFYDKREGLSDGALKTSRNHQPSLIISRWLRDDYQE